MKHALILITAMLLSSLTPVNAAPAEPRPRTGLQAVPFNQVRIDAASPGYPSGLARLKAREVKPKGWILEQMRRDLNDGYISHYEKLSRIAGLDLFAHQSQISSQNPKSWWPGEVEGDWKDGMLRLAFLTGNKAEEERSLAWIDAILAKQKESGGYIGVYSGEDKPNTRFRHEGVNGELWTQARIMQAILAAYEFTGEGKYLDAVQRAVDLTMEKMPGTYFNPGLKTGGGVSHGIDFFQTLSYLYFATGERRYADFAIKLYADFNASPVRDDDLKTAYLLDPGRRFSKHGAHVAEGVDVPFFIAALTGNPDQQKVAQATLRKLKSHLAPGGALVGDENVRGMDGTSEVPYEYCTNVHLEESLGEMIALTGDMEFADIYEKSALNAGQGGRLPVLKALSYLTKDNRMSIDNSEHSGRMAYAATHGAAPCCTLNGARLMPYYVANMWMRSTRSPELVAVLLGPSEVSATLGGVALRVSEETAYPFSDEITFKVNPEKPVRFTLAVRVPANADGVTVGGVPQAEVSKGKDLVRIAREWKIGDAVTVRFQFPVKKIEQPQVKDNPAEYYLQRGPLVYALPFPTKVVPKKEINGTGFYIYTMENENPTAWKYKWIEGENFTLQATADGDPLHPWEKPPMSLHGKMENTDGKPVDVALVPEGCTVLRRVTFPKATPALNDFSGESQKAPMAGGACIVGDDRIKAEINAQGMVTKLEVNRLGKWEAVDFRSDGYKGPAWHVAGAKGNFTGPYPAMPSKRKASGH